MAHNEESPKGMLPIPRITPTLIHYLFWKQNSDDEKNSRKSNGSGE